MCFETVEMYRTPDGKYHETESDARSHIVRCVEDKLGPLIDGVNKELNPQHYLTPRAKLALMDALVGTPEKIEALRRLLG